MSFVSFDFHFRILSYLTVDPRWDWYKSKGRNEIKEEKNRDNKKEWKKIH